MAKGKFVAYYRVSTEKQGKSRLGLEAQRDAVTRHVQSVGGTLSAPPFEEVESGKRSDRPELAKALARCRAIGATLIVAKLDRLSRNVAFLSALMESKVEFICADNPHATKFTVHILAAVAEHEREMISKRTKDALAAAKARGTVLGGRRPNTPDIRKYQRKGSAAAAHRIDEHIADIADELRALQAQGLTMCAMARHLNDNDIRSTRGGRWTAKAVIRALARL